MKKTKNALKIIALLPCMLLLLSCNIEDESQASAVLLFARLSGKDIAGNEVDYLESDIVTGGAYYSDIASANLEAKMRAPELLLPGTSYKNSVVVDQYEVTYMQSYEGGGVEGVNVPYSFKGALSAVIDIDASVDISFVLVRTSAKLDPPLFNLIASGNILQLVARVDFYGRDLAGNNVQATGYLTIYFANYIDPP